MQCFFMPLVFIRDDSRCACVCALLQEDGIFLCDNSVRAQQLMCAHRTAVSVCELYIPMWYMDHTYICTPNAREQMR